MSKGPLERVAGNINKRTVVAGNINKQTIVAGNINKRTPKTSLAEVSGLLLKVPELQLRLKPRPRTEPANFLGLWYHLVRELVEG